jgi:hypothetical protein
MCFFILMNGDQSELHNRTHTALLHKLNSRYVTNSITSTHSTLYTVHRDIVFEELQNDIEKLKNEKGSLQQALSESEVALSNLKYEMSLLKAQVCEAIHRCL